MLSLAVTGMTCGHCVRAITQAVQEVDPQAVVKVDIADRAVSVQTTAASDRIVDAIRDAGYEAKAKT